MDFFVSLRFKISRYSSLLNYYSPLFFVRQRRASTACEDEVQASL
jgi:hypothetical protein